MTILAVVGRSGQRKETLVQHVAASATTPCTIVRAPFDHVLINHLMHSTREITILLVVWAFGGLPPVVRERLDAAWCVDSGLLSDDDFEKMYINPGGFDRNRLRGV